MKNCLAAFLILIGSCVAISQIKLPAIISSNMVLQRDDSLSIHPPRKREVADRLLGLALAETYGFEGLNPQSPVFKSAEPQEGQLLLTFDHVPDGVYAAGDLTGFEIAGQDHIFYPAEAKIEKRKQVLVWSDNVKDPVAIRYAWSNYVEGTLFGVNMLPVSSFRSDTGKEAR